MEQAREAYQDLWRQFTTVPHRVLGPAVTSFGEAINDDPDRSAQTLVHLFKTSKIRDLQEAAIAALFQADGNLYPDYREAARAMLLGDRVYNIEPEGPWGLEPYRILRVVQFLRSPVVVFRGEQEVGRFPTEREANANLDRLARRISRGEHDSTALGLRVSRLTPRQHPQAIRQVRRAVTDYLEALHRNPDWWFGVEFQNKSALHWLYKVKGMTDAGFKPPNWVRDAVFSNIYPSGSKRGVLREIASSDNPEHILELVERNRIGYRMLQSVLPDRPWRGIILVASMSPKEARNSRAWVERDGLLEIPEVKQAYIAKVARATEGISAIGHRESTKGQDVEVEAAMQTARDKGAKQAASIEGTVAIFVDRSGSMHEAIRLAAPIAARITAHAKDEVHLVIFDSAAKAIDVTGMSLTNIERITSRVRPGGSTSMTSAWKALARSGVTPNKAIWITDGGENVHPFLGETLNDWEGQTVEVLVDNRWNSPFAQRLRESGRIVDTIEVKGEDYNLPDQIAALVGGPAARTVGDLIAETQIPRIVA